MHRPRLRIAVCGRLHGSEADAFAAALRQLPADAEIRWSDGPATVWPQFAGGADLCVVLQSWPDEIPLRTAQALIAACSAGRLICCQGAWCASACRTRATWPPAVCVPIEQFASRLSFELEVLAGRRASVPATASRDEAFAAHYALNPDSDAVSATVDSSDSVYARELRLALQYSATDECGNCIVIDSDPTSSDPRCSGEAVQIVVAGFPLPEQISALQGAGARAIVSKLAPLSELQSVINRAVASRS